MPLLVQTQAYTLTLLLIPDTHLVELQECLVHLYGWHLALQVLVHEGKEIVGGHLDLAQDDGLVSSGGLYPGPLRFPAG